MDNVRAAQLEASEAIRPLIQRFIDTNFGTQYYSLEDLRSMGHPYAASFGTRTRIPVSKPDWVINTQSGELYRSIVIDINHNTGDSTGAKYARITVDSDSPVGAVINYGTKYMRPRPWRDAMMKIFYTEFTNRLSNEFRRNIRIRISMSGNDLLLKRGERIL